MTILTKPSNDKKAIKIPLPLGIGAIGQDHMEKSLLGNQQHYLPHNGSDVESVDYNHPPAFNCVKNGLTVLLIFITILLGMFGGYFIYRSFGTSDNPTKFHYRTLCDVPYELSSNLTMPRFYPQSDDFDFNFNWLLPRLTSGNSMENSFNNDESFFREEIEMDLSDDESYTKIDVPDFKDGRHGRFMHDFKENQSAIIDTTANRCFIMPLDRNSTLPPKSFMDLMEKMGSGYYNIDTDRVRRNMRVVFPPISDLTLISERIANECYDMKVYMLENYVSGVFKREAKPITEHGKFAEYSGKGIVEFDIINIADIEEYEKQHPKYK